MSKLSITVTDRVDDFKAELTHPKGIWGCGKTLQSAIGDCVMTAASHGHLVLNLPPTPKSPYLGADRTHLTGPTDSSYYQRMNATAIPGSIVVINQYDIEGTFGIVTACADHDAFEKLPAAVEYQGRTLGKSGWNSDKGHAYYQSNVKVAKAV